MDLRDRGDQRALGLFPARDQAVEKIRLDERLVALDVEEEISGEVLNDAGHAGGARRTGRIGHQDFGAETARDAGDFFGIGEEDDTVGLTDLLGAFPDMLDDGLAAEIEQDLAGQARGSDAGGDAESDGGHF